jgi:predicted dehydrogenase
VRSADPVRLGVIGCGAVMPHYMAAAAPLVRGGAVTLVAAADVDAGKRALCEGRHGFRRFSTDWRAVVEAPDVDAVLVLTPMGLHAEMACAALAAGKHVLVEKVMAPTLPEAAAMIAAARAHDRHLVCAPHVVLSPTFRAILGRVRRGEIGRVLAARARYGWADPFWQGGWVYGKQGGALFEFACYNVTSLTALVGPVRRVSAAATTVFPERELGGARVAVEAEDNAHVLLDFGGGVLGAVTTSFVFQRTRCPAVELYGSEGTAQLLGDDWEPRGHEVFRNRDGCWTVYDEPDPAWSWADGLGHLVDCIRAGRRPAVTPEHAFHVLEILVRAREAAADGRTRAVESRFDPPDLAGGVTP